ncbi:LysR family transcriptional regulator [Streptomyces sp. NPDC096311]|uniref:LysR family transcriptional regulator n=1 Tax=Streptomyces sp. NPDC096311 TaxID=3366083 RepID=UPI003809D6FF
MDISKLEHCVAVAREGSFAAAAATIPLSQSALTRSIQSLERTYGITIFERGKNGVRLTGEGEEFIAIAEEILWSAGRAEERLTAVATGENATVRFGAGSAMASSILPAVLACMEARSVHFEIRTGSNAILRSLLSRGEIDFFLGAVPTTAQTYKSAYGYRVEVVAPVVGSLMVAMRAGHPLAEGLLFPERVEQFPVACKPFMKSRYEESGLAELGIRHPAIYIDDYHVLVKLIHDSDFIMLSNWAVDTLQPPGEIVTRSLPAPNEFQHWSWGFVSSSHTSFSAAASAVLEAVRDHIKGLSAV